MHQVKPTNDHAQEERRRDDAPAITMCPLCEGAMEIVYDRNGQQVMVCADCHTGITVPATAWNIARAKREAKKKP